MTAVEIKAEFLAEEITSSKAIWLLIQLGFNEWAANEYLYGE